MKSLISPLFVCLMFAFAGCGGPEHSPEMPGAGVDPNLARDNLRRIGVAFHNHHDVNRVLPSYIRGEDGTPLLSWRVAILPYLDQRQLYDQFKLEEPWDSEHNIKLLDQMPEVFRTHDSQSDTSVAMIVDQGTIYEGGDGLKMNSCTDGTSNTLLAVRAGKDRAVPWTQPQDLPFNRQNPLAAFGSIEGDRLLTLFVDGSVRFLNASIKSETLRSLITRNGHEVIEGF